MRSFGQRCVSRLATKTSRIRRTSSRIDENRMSWKCPELSYHWRTVLASESGRGNQGYHAVTYAVIERQDGFYYLRRLGRLARSVVAFSRLIMYCARRMVDFVALQQRFRRGRMHRRQHREQSTRATDSNPRSEFRGSGESSIDDEKQVPDAYRGTGFET